MQEVKENFSTILRLITL